MQEISLGLQHELEELVRKAGQHILKLWPGKRGGNSHLKVTPKPDGSLVTNADYESNQIIVEGLRRLTPKIAIFSEEGPLDSEEIPLTPAWVLDPIDGTNYFLEGKSHFRILLGLLDQGRVVMGIMYFPTNDKLYVAQRAKGCFLNQQSLRVSSHKDWSQAKLFLNHLQAKNVALPKHVSIDTALACIQLCEKELDAGLIRITEHKTWDLLPYIVMTQESGGMVTDEHGAEPLFRNIAPKMGYLVFSNGILHQDLLAALKTWK